MRSFWVLLRYHLRTECRSPSQMIAIGLLVWIVNYFIYRANPLLGMGEFSFLYWVFFMLIAINAVMRIEVHNDESEHYFLYTTCDPQQYYLAKLLFNILYLFMISIILYLSFYFFFSDQLTFQFSLFLLMLLGSVAVASCMTFVSTISHVARGQNTLLSILAMPILLPVILILKSASDEQLLLNSSSPAKYLTLTSIILITIALSLILFPTLWKR